uniref:Uncharacterized protein n=1 Tax=Anguilla anguilla TaxID=7936 RepID=A0A0E9TGK1_ANGAN
MSNNWRIIET